MLGTAVALAIPTTVIARNVIAEPDPYRDMLARHTFEIGDLVTTDVRMDKRLTLVLYGKIVNVMPFTLYNKEPLTPDEMIYVNGWLAGDKLALVYWEKFKQVHMCPVDQLEHRTMFA